MSNLRGKGVALYHLTLTTATAIQHAVYGNFSAKGQSEICVSRGQVLQLLRPDARLQVQVVSSVEVFGQIRCLSTFRLPGAPTDYIVVGSDSGRIVILQYSLQKRAFVKVHQETFGRSGCRRIVPGQYVACDPSGRAVMVAAVEKQKFLYVLNRDSANQLTISSPLEAHKSRHIVFALAALDNGFENPLFAAVELDYTDADEDATGEGASEAQKLLVFYELDLGLNHVTRKWSEPCDNGAVRLFLFPLALV
jgi:splicing factor 3B subunit 3